MDTIPLARKAISGITQAEAMISNGTLLRMMEVGFEPERPKARVATVILLPP
jgi:hypothetical protein